MNLLGQETQPCSDERLCDLCNTSKALLYCRADSAKLCFNCDREAHSTNQLFHKHRRFLLCDGCDSSPASIFCFTDSAVLCQNCDWEIHSNIPVVHDRRPIEGFTGCPSVGDLLSFLGFEDLGKKDSVEDGCNSDEWMDLLVLEPTSVVCLDDLLVINDDLPSPDPAFQAQSIAVTPLPKNRNASCGKYKEEMITQLREMAKTEPDFGCCLQDLESKSKAQLADESAKFDHTVSLPISLSDVCDDGLDEMFDFSNFIEINPESPDVGISHVAQEAVADFYLVPKLGKNDINTPERGSALTRYKEKKKNRRYSKQIRYEARKVRAEARTRIHGRFAKIER